MFFHRLKIRPLSRSETGSCRSALGIRLSLFRYLDLKALRESCDLAPDGPLHDHVVADDPRAVAECHPAAGFPNFRSPLVGCRGGKRNVVWLKRKITPYSRPYQLKPRSHRIAKKKDRFLR